MSLGAVGLESNLRDAHVPAPHAHLSRDRPSLRLSPARAPPAGEPNEPLSTTARECHLVPVPCLSAKVNPVTLLQSAFSYPHSRLHLKHLLNLLFKVLTESQNEF